MDELRRQLEAAVSAERDEARAAQQAMAAELEWLRVLLLHP